MTFNLNTRPPCAATRLHQAIEANQHEPGAAAPLAAHPARHRARSPAPMVLIPLTEEKRAYIPTREAAAHLLKQVQTLRWWHSRGCYPEGLKPIKLGNGLGWPVAGIRRVLGLVAGK